MQKEKDIRIQDTQGTVWTVIKYLLLSAGAILMVFPFI